MKKTGIVRRIDNLGRIVIAKELRTLYGMNVGDAVEMFTDDDGTIILKKFPLEDKLTESVNAMRTMIDEYGDALPVHVSVALKKHTFEMLKLLEEEQKK